MAPSFSGQPYLSVTIETVKIPKLPLYATSVTSDPSPGAGRTPDFGGKK
jgi:hypothetical protein